MTLYADLHTHSDYSDGLHDPEGVVRAADQAGICALALTDHDSMAGVEEARQACRRRGMEFVPGVEISVGDDPDRDRYDLHIVGLFVDPESPAIRDFLSEQAAQRTAQKRAQLRRFRELGFVVDEEQLFGTLKGVPGKPHLVEMLVRLNPGITPAELYSTYLGYGGKAHVAREREPSAEEAIEVIHAAGGVALLAHPCFYAKVKKLEGLVRDLVASGLDGIELDCPYELARCFAEVPGGREAIVARMKRLAAELDLAVSGGSDFHGGGKGGPLGSAGLDEPAFTRLKERAARRRASA